MDKKELKLSLRNGNRTGHMTKILYTDLNYDDTGGLQYCIKGFSEHQTSNKDNTLYYMTIVRNFYSS